MTHVVQLAPELAPRAVCAVRAALHRGALVGAALLIAILGARFLVFAGYIGMSFLVGPGLAALMSDVSSNHAEW